jgi:hypothetical protein
VSLILNFSPIDFDDREIKVGRLSYGTNGQEVLRELREKHNETHVFRREGDCIFAVQVTSDACCLGEPVTIKLSEYLWLVAALVRNALLRYLVGLGRPVLDYDPLTFIGRDDLLRACLPQKIAVPDWLAVRVLHEIGVRPVSFCDEPFVAAAIDVRTTRRIERSVWQLMQEGFTPEGLYKRTRVLRKNPRLAPDFELLGRVVSIEGSRLRLTDSRDEVETVEAAEVWLETRAFPACLRHVFGERAPKVFEALQRERAAVLYGPKRLERIRKIVEFFGSKPHGMAPGVPFTFGALLESSKPSFPQRQRAPQPVFVFDQAGSKTDTWNDGGLIHHGPYTAQVFTPNVPRICVVCQQSMKGQVEQFLQKFKEGIKLPPPVVRGRATQIRTRPNYFEKGFCRKYALQGIHYDFFTAENNSAESYQRACQTALEQLGSGQKWDLAMVQIEEPFHELPARNNPYYGSKVSFHTHQVPVQEFEIETTRRPDSQLIYVLNNMGLATYAKLNGIPWLLKANPTVAHELIIGLGSARVGEGRLGAHERFVGITTVFSGDGNYHLSNISKAVPISQYKSALLESLRAAILKVRQDMNWQPKDHVRLIFHAEFKPFKRNEAESIEGLVSCLGDYDVEYAFVQVSEDQPYILFDKGQGGVFDPDTGRTKGVYAPERGWYLELGEREVLLSLTGSREVKRPEDGTPRPLLLRLHRNSSFTDMTYLTRQVFAFACHSWRTFLPASVPVTIQYSDLIARALGNFSLMDRWNPEVMLGRIGKTRWFL